MTLAAMTRNETLPAWGDLTKDSALDIFKISAPQLKGLDVPRFIDSCFSNHGEFIVTLGKQGAPSFIARDLNLNGDGNETLNVLYLSAGERVVSGEHGQGQALMQFGQAAQCLGANGYSSADLHRLLNQYNGGEPGEPTSA
jgi:hypothetical protein